MMVVVVGETRVLNGIYLFVWAKDRRGGCMLRMCGFRIIIIWRVINKGMVRKLLLPATLNVQLGFDF